MEIEYGTPEFQNWEVQRGESREQGCLLHRNLKDNLGSLRPCAHTKQEPSVDRVQSRFKSMLSRRLQGRSRDEQIVEGNRRHRNKG